MSRLDVRKTYKLHVGGKFPRSESGRSYEVTGADGAFLANAAWASRKDVRDAVVAARAAQPGWAAASAYNRGQVLYRVAEVLEGRRGQLIDELTALHGDAEAAAAEVDATTDRLVWFAGWTDKYGQVDGAANPVAGPFFNLSVPEPVGVVGAIAPQRQALLGLVDVVAPIVASGNTCVVVASQDRPLPAVTFGEVLATSDVPGGVINVLTGRVAELAPVLAGHLDVDALDLAGCAGVDDVDVTALRVDAAENVKRVVPPPTTEVDRTPVPAAGPHTILRFCETKTVWHPKGT